MPDTNVPPHYRMQICLSMAEIGELNWNQLLTELGICQVFLSYGFLHSLEHTACVGETAEGHSGWQSCYLTLWEGPRLAAALPLYQKLHSYGEYVFDWSWAEAAQRYGQNYYPKLVSAIPFSPICGPRLLACSAAAKTELIRQLRHLCDSLEFSSAHILFPIEEELTDWQQQGFQQRQGIQFHWQNPGYANFDDFLHLLVAKKRKNILAERRKVSQAGIRFEHRCGEEIRSSDWQFFYHCYVRTYREHRSSPYLNLDFFLQLAQEVPENLLLILAYDQHQAIAAALYLYDKSALYGRYWGCLERYDSLHFETAFYQGQEFCIRNSIPRFEGGAQGPHKIARGFNPVWTNSMHYLREPWLSSAVTHFLEREQEQHKITMQEFLTHAAYRSE